MIHVAVSFKATLVSVVASYVAAVISFVIYVDEALAVALQYLYHCLHIIVD